LTAANITATRVCQGSPEISRRVRGVRFPGYRSAAALDEH